MKKNQASSKISVKNKDNSILLWIIGILSSITLFYFPYKTALFNGNTTNFDQEIFNFIMFATFSILCSIIYIFTQKGNTSTIAWSLIISVVPLSYCLSLINSASKQLGINMLLLSITFAGLFISSRILSSSKLGATILQFSILASGYTVVFYGFMALFGNIYSQDAVMGYKYWMRLTSVFQYPNAYSSYLIALLLCALYITTISKNKFWISINSFMLVPILISFLLTLSRGGLIILPVAFIIILAFLPIVKQLFLCAVTFITILVSLIIHNWIRNIGVNIQETKWDGIPDYFNPFQGESFKGWLILVLASAFVMALILAIKKFTPERIINKFKKLHSKPKSSLVIPIFICLACFISFFLITQLTSLQNVLPDSIRQRILEINTNEHSYNERISFYKDAMKIIRDYPVIGAGGGAWSVLYGHYQSYPYTSRQAHNFFLQYTIETGFIGIILFACTVLFVIISFIRNYIKHPNEGNGKFVFFIILISLLMHSTLDFEMSYAYLAAIVFISLGVLASSTELNLPTKNYVFSKRIALTLNLASIVIFILLFNEAYKYRIAINNFQTAVSNANRQQPVQNILGPLEKAIKNHPSNNNYLTTRINIYNQLYRQNNTQDYYDKIKNYIKEAKKPQPHSVSLFSEESSLYVTANDVTSLTALFNEYREQFPWELSIYEKGILDQFDLGVKARDVNNVHEMNERWQAAMDINEKFINQKYKIEELLPKDEAKNFFNPTLKMTATLGQIHFLKGNYSEAKASFETIIMPDNLNDSYNRFIMRWYLASALKLKVEVSEIYNKFTKDYANEKNEIDQLLKLAAI